MRENAPKINENQEEWILRCQKLTNGHSKFRYLCSLSSFFIKVISAASFEEVWCRRFAVRNPKVTLTHSETLARETCQLFVRGSDYGPGSELMMWPENSSNLLLAFPIRLPGSGSG